MKFTEEELIKERDMVSEMLNWIIIIYKIILED